MKKYAVIEIKGRQYLVEEGVEYNLDFLGDEKLDINVLLVSNGKTVKVGTPYIKNPKVKLKIIDKKVKGTKMYIKKFKAKSRYRRKYGFRPVFTRVLVEKIS
jgi:large subunit ribosomal protein L21